MEPKCDKCGNTLDTYGALAFSPPEKMPDGSCKHEVEKYHICLSCWKLFKDWLFLGNSLTQENVNEI